jgi:hydrogenase maturation factor HypF (carbamoyltransferase family)
MNLPHDVALCDGNDSPACETCARRLADPYGRRYWIAPIADGDECELKIEVEHE